MPYTGFSFEQWAAFMLIFVRASSLILTLPFFGSTNVPPMVKAGLSLSLAILLLPSAPVDPGAYPRDLWGLAPLVVGELMIGTILGLVVRLILTAVQIMGQLIGFQMGFAVANVLDPMGGGQVSVLAQFCYLMALLVVFSVGGHLIFFQALADSFAIVGPGRFTLSRALHDQVMWMSGQMFVLAIRIGAPVIGALLFTQVVMGVLAKSVPQLNILIVGFPITLTVGFLFLGVTISLMLPILGKVFQGLGPILHSLLRAM